MAAASIFDCDSPDVLDLPRRQLITYDDDLFGFGDGASDHDELDMATKNLKITVTIDENRKRKRLVDQEDDDDFYHEPKKKRISNVPSCSSSNNTSSSNASAKSHAQKNESHSKTKKLEYTLIEEIGQGTYGQVWKGKCNRTQAVCAIKRLSCKLNTRNTVCVHVFHRIHLDIVFNIYSIFTISIGYQIGLYQT